MKKIYKIIFDNEYILKTENIKKISKEKIILNKNIYKIEKNNSLKIFPIENIEKNFRYIKYLTNGKINHIIFSTETPKISKRIDKLSFEKIKTGFEEIIDLLKQLININLSKNNFQNITIIIHKNYKNIKTFWIKNELINNNIKLILKNIFKEYNKKGIKINLISTERMINVYKKIYINKKIKKNSKIEKIINYIEKKNIKNKIIKI